MEHRNEVRINGVVKFPPDLKHVGANGIALCKTKLEVVDPARGKGKERKNYIALEAWSGEADTLSVAVVGQEVKVAGRLRENKWQKRDSDEWVREVVVVAEKVDLVGGRQAPADEPDYDESDIPF